jgi:site-specific DNA-methyltransferase (adenine-specific)
MSITIYNADCFDILSTIQDKSIDLVILDLPYGQTECHWDIPIDLTQLWIQLKRISKPNTAFLFFTTTKFGYKLIQANEKWFRYDIVWNKCNTLGFLNAHKMPLRTHEMIYVFYEKLPTYNIKNYHTYNNKGKATTKADRSNVYGSYQGVSNGKWDPLLPVSMLTYPVLKTKKFHSTMKPHDLLVWLIKYYSNEGDTILDPTMGSGSTGMACKELNRNFIGIEKDATIFEIANKRIHQNQEANQSIQVVIL